MFLERKILGRIHGEKHRHMHAIVGLGSLRDSIGQFPKDSPATQLVVDLRDTDPDDVFSTVPYEKGHTLLAYLEEQVGGPTVFEPYLRAHIQHFSGKSITSEQWRAFLLKYFQDNPEATQKLTNLDWNAWLCGRGMPPALPKYDDELVVPCRALAASYLPQSDASNTMTVDEAHRLFASFTLQQKLIFLDALLDYKDRLDLATLGQLQSVHEIGKSTNVELLLKWYMLNLHLKDETVFPDVVKYITQHGRMKYNRPLYRLMAAVSAKGAKLAHDTFQEHRSFYHPIAATMIAKDLGLK